MPYALKKIFICLFLYKTQIENGGSTFLPSILSASRGIAASVSLKARIIIRNNKIHYFFQDIMHLLGVGEFAPNSLIIDCLATFACHEEMATAVMFLFLAKSYKVL